jgi:transposase
MGEVITVIGVDLGDRSSELCILGPGDAVRREKLSTSRAAFGTFFQRTESSRVVLEAGTHSGWASELLAGLGHEVVVANPRRLRLISESDNKTDRHDAELLARLGRSDVKLLNPIQHRARDYHRDLLLVRSRDALVRTRSLLINSARGLAKAMGERLASCDAGHFHNLRSKLPEHLRSSLEPLLEIIEQTTAQIASLDDALEELAAKRYPETKRLCAIHGVGTVTALTFIITVGDPGRFEKSRALGAYFGLRTRRRSSSRSNPELSITKAGDPYVRKLLVSAATTILRPRAPESDLKRWAEKLAERGGMRAKKVARVALARKLAVVMHRLLITGEEYKALGYTKRAA